VAIISVSGDCRYASLSTHLLALDVQLDLRNVRPEEQGNRPVEGWPASISSRVPTR